MATGRYTNKEMAAPMVRASTLPFREECLRYGADYVFTEEIIDKKLIASSSKVLDDGTVLFYTGPQDGRTVQFLPERKEQTILQLGTADGVLASKAAVKVLDYVSEVNINMGCPKSFSIQGGMGAALLTKPELACDIVRTLRSTLPSDIPVTCKIRFIGDIDQADPLIKTTSEFMQGLSSAGASAITVHMRTTPMRPRDPAVWPYFPQLLATLPGDFIPVIANGDFFTRPKIDTFRESVNAQMESINRTWSNSVMIARGAMLNPSIFSKTSTPSPETVMDEFLAACEKFNEPKSTTKWTLAQMIESVSEFNGEPMKRVRERIHEAKTIEELAKVVRGGNILEDDFTNSDPKRQKQLD